VRKGLHQDLAIILALLFLSILFWWPVTVGGKTLLPADKVFTWAPWNSYAQEAGITVPHNGLLDDLYLENYVWKRLIVESLRARQLPLWNPYILSGVPFLAAGQHSAMYPFSVLFYVLPLTSAYGWFAALHLFLAGTFTYFLARTLHIKRLGAMVAAVTFMFGGFMVIRNVFPMIIAAAVWLPLILTAIERIIQREERGPARITAHIPDAVLGTGAAGMVFLAGHPEMYYYVGLVSGFYALWRLVGLTWRTHRWASTARSGAILVAIAALGVGLGAGQWLPLLELVQQNFREGGASLSQVLSWAYPPRRVISLLIPDFFGNPAHHSYFDLFTFQRVPVTVNALGQQIDSIYWGIKNYVEGASYIGVLPLLLAAIALLKRKGRHIWFFATLAIVSLLFVFGSPLYALMYYLPGLNQVHSPFRWIYPYTLCIGILAGMGCDALRKSLAPTENGRRWPRLADRLADPILPAAATLGGAALLGGLALSLLFKERVAALAERAMYALAKAPEAFADGRMFYSYEFRNLAIFGLALLAGGGVLLLRPRLHRPHVWGGLVVAVIVAELFVIGKPFFPANDPALVEYRTPGIDLIKQDDDLFRITSLVGGDEKTMNANTGMLYDLYDVRGYDSIIPRQYVDYMQLLQEQGELPYNRIAPLNERNPEALDSPLLDMLNVKYIVTAKERSIDNPGYTLVYDGEMRVYRHEDAMPRAFMVAQGVNIPNADERREALCTFDPRQVVILEETPRQEQVSEVPADFDYHVESVIYSPNEVLITAKTPIPCFLVLGDSFFNDWKAFIRPANAGQDQEQELHIYRANGNFRAVELPPGEHLVRFKYSPDTVKLGLYTSFLAGVVLMLSLAFWGWQRYYREPQANAEIQRVTKNTIAPVGLELVNRMLDMVFAMLMLRMLGAADAGQYTTAVLVVTWVDIFVNFGLNTLLTREISRDKAHANRYLSSAIIARLGLCLVAVPLLGLFFLARRFTVPIQPKTMLAIGLFGLGLVPSNVAASISAVFMAHERMEIPASVSTFTTLLRVSLGILVLVAGAGYIGLAGVSIVVNIVTMITLYLLLRATVLKPVLEVDWQFLKKMLAESYPLMINSLLATLFFKMLILLLEWLPDDPRVVGWYGAAYKYIDAVNIIPAYFTLAIFPLMSRYAAEAKESLLKAYRLAVKMLLIVALPAALIGGALSYELVTLLGGSDYVPQGAEILSIVIWYMPFGFINSVTQYVLIALNQQRFLTRAFAIGLLFNVVANVILIQTVGWMSSAFIAVISEIVLFIPFYIGVRRHLARIAWGQIIWKQAVSAIPLALLIAFLPHRQVLFAIPVGLVLYAVGLVVLSVFDKEERGVVGQILPVNRVRGRITAALDRLAQR
jgi:O-antigen/teichoic acid export membrane protein